jgi:EAL domain-containing protein (putative c-di-GMP-specific phosphodiesterase class I)
VVAAHNAEGRDLRLSVNLSPKDLRSADLLEAMGDILEATGLAANRLEIELTETAVINDLEASRQVLEQVRALGVGVVLDDFGTGYASLTHLHGLPVNRVKIDRSFVGRSEEDDDAASIVRALVGLAHSLNLAVVAEGIETPGQVALLQALGCDEGQGYLFAEPAPAHACPALAPAYDVLTPA